MAGRFSLFLVLLGVIPCLFAVDGFLGSIFPYGTSSKSFPGFVFPDAALPTRSGYFTVNETSRARMFYTFYEAIEPRISPTEVPIILWLQGGPGCSSMTGNFYEFGPWRTAPDLLLHKNTDTWNQKFALLFIDSPVGTGFSIAEKDEDIPSDQEQVATQLFRGLTTFFALNPTYQKRPFYIGGESYGGKYVPALGHYIMRRMEKREFWTGISMVTSQNGVPFHLHGLLIGNGLTHPIDQVQTHGDTAYSFGLIDKIQKLHVNELAKGVVKLVEKEDWYAAYEARTALMDWIKNVTGLATPLDVRRSVPYHCSPDGTEFLEQFLNQKTIKQSLGAEEGATWVSCNPRVREAMAIDTMKSVKWMIEELLPRIPILLYQGVYDMKDGVACNEEWMQTLAWEGTQNFLLSPRNIWHVNNNVAGYWRSFGTLSHVVVLGAGHLVPADQGLHSQKMIERWIEQHVQS